jgi:hypothetical protein
MDPLFVGSGGVGHGPRPTPAMSSESSGSEFFFFFFFFLLYYDVCRFQFVDIDEGDEFDVLPVHTLCTLL